MANQPLFNNMLIDAQIKEIKRQANTKRKQRSAKQAKKQEPCD
jgi:hypothetical protein